MGFHVKLEKIVIVSDEVIIIAANITSKPTWYTMCEGSQ